MRSPLCLYPIHNFSVSEIGQSQLEVTAIKTDDPDMVDIN